MVPFYSGRPPLLFFPAIATHYGVSYPLSAPAVDSWCYVRITGRCIMRPKEGNPMADIKLTRPAAGQNVVVPSAPDARMVLDFAADQVSIDRPQGSARQ